MYLQARNGRLNSYYLFQLEFFCGNYERAAELLEFMDCTHWCWHCRQKECSDTWECKGYMALIRGQKEEAIRCFEQAVACALDRNDQASCELRRLYLEKER